MWTPGYWAWDGYDYYWVPGTWVLAPRPGLLWTPGYWGWSDGIYVFHDGYWAPNVGFYGSVAYGFGYTGVGYEGGYWNNGNFFYNRTVNNVTNVSITNVYIKNVTVNQTINNVSYNGGAGGIVAQPRPEELAIAREAHVAATPVQLQHVQAATKDRSLFASTNHGAPPIAATMNPGVLKGSGVVPAKASGSAHPQPLPHPVTPLQAEHAVPAAPHPVPPPQIEHALPPAPHLVPPPQGERAVPRILRRRRKQSTLCAPSRIPRRQSTLCQAGLEALLRNSLGVTAEAACLTRLSQAAPSALTLTYDSHTPPEIWRHGSNRQCHRLGRRSRTAVSRSWV
jgi:WXXGXW repeat (2 copies)